MQRNLMELIMQRTLALLSLYCQTQENAAQLAALSQGLLLKELPEGALDELDWCIAQESAYQRAQGITVRIDTLVQNFALGFAARFGVELCLTAIRYPQLQPVLHTLDPQEITVELLHDILETLDRPCETGYQGMENTNRQLRQLLCADSCVQEREKVPFYRQSFAADERLLGYFFGSNTMDLALSPFTKTFLSETPLIPAFCAKQQLKQLVVALERFVQEQSLLQIVGNAGAGKRFLLSHACQQTGWNLLMIDYKLLRTHPPKETKQIVWAIARELLLCDFGVCFYHLEEDLSDNHDGVLDAFLQYCIFPLLSLSKPIIVCTAPSVEIISKVDVYVEKVSIPEVNREDRIALWQGYGRLYRIADQFDAVNVGSKFKLSPKEIQKAAQRLSYQAAEQKLFSEEEISNTCAAVLPIPTQGGIRRIEVSYTLEDLKLLPEQKKVLQNLCAHVQQRHKVYDQWNMESRYAYGKNVSGLFVGAPGTGKTMAVHVLSNMLKIPLYRIDLSQVVDKYIGETEKRLEEIFNIAEKSNTILFFDEADSIFGKRSEVNDAKDKYANTEVSYILQRIEQYDGIVILATNYKKNIDEAFMRRIRYLVEFQMPTEELRREIWQSSFAKEVPLEAIDFAYLARQFKLAGGSIKNIVLNATFLAATENQSVTMKHILDSVKNENLKMGQTMLQQDFGEYAPLF